MYRVAGGYGVRRRDGWVGNVDLVTLDVQKITDKSRR